jgi:hypothetical protein
VGVNDTQAPRMSGQMLRLAEFLAAVSLATDLADDVAGSRLPEAALHRFRPGIQGRFDLVQVVRTASGLG